jgi:hypothetical protein
MLNALTNVRFWGQSGQCRGSREAITASEGSYSPVVVDTDADVINSLRLISAKSNN